MMPKVSVVIPTWNRCDLLPDALASVLRQTDQDFEILVVDDHSIHGNAGRIVRDLGDPRIHYIRLPDHRGVGAARNIAIAHSTGSYVAFLDDDDEWLPQKLSVQLQALEVSPRTVGGVYSARLTIDRETGQAAVHRFRQRPFNPWHGTVITTSSLVVRRSCFDVVGCFDERLTAGGDWDMWLRIATQFRFLYIDRILVKYLHHRDSISGDSLKHAPSRELILKKHAELFGRRPRSFAGRYKRLGLLYYRHGEVEKARQLLRTAIRIWPFCLGAYWGLLQSSLRSTPRLPGGALSSTPPGRADGPS